LETKDLLTKKNIVILLLFVMSLYHLYIGFFGIVDIWRHRAIHIGFVLVITWLIKPLENTLSFKNENVKKILNFFDVVSFTLIILLSSYMVIFYEEIQWRAGIPDIYDKIATMIFLLAILEACRRLVGIILTFITSIFAAYLFFGSYIPGRLGYPGFSYNMITDRMFNATFGFLGSAIGVASTFIIIFILFASFLKYSGAGEYFSNLAAALSGRSMGGPAKTAVVASALMGMVTGTPSGNVAATGSITIPLMKRFGYPSHFAAAVEGSASMGGSIMPPIMGAVVFLMAEWTDTPYITICRYALLPALLFFFGIYISVHCEAIKLNLLPMDSDKLPKFWPTFISGIHYFISLAILIYLLMSGLTPMKSGLYAIISLVILSMFRKETRMNPRKIFDALIDGSRTMLIVSAACAAGGVIMAVVTQTGLGMKLAAMIRIVSGGMIFPALILTMIVSLVLGMGMASIAAYLILASVVAPALVQMGVQPVVAHLFCYYYGMLSNVTPPVAIGAFVAAGIADADQMKTAFTATKLSLVAFILPFMWVFDSRLMLIGPPQTLILPIITAFIGTFCLASAIQGLLLIRLNIFTRLLLFSGSMFLVYPGIMSDLIGFPIIVIVLIFIFLQKHKQKTVSLAKA